MKLSVGSGRVSLIAALTMCAGIFDIAFGTGVTVALKRTEALHRLRKSLSPQALHHPEVEGPYIGQLTAGTPPQLFNVAFDTGSGNIILPSQACQTTACKNRGHLYDRTRSSTARAVHIANATSDEKNLSSNVTRRRLLLASDRRWQYEDITLTFGEGLVGGIAMRDRICLGGGDGGLCAEADFVAATYESEDPFKDASFDGVLGLGLAPLAQRPSFSFLGQALGSSAVPKKCRFAMFLGYDGEPSEITFGELLENKTTEAFFWSPVLSPTLGFWQVGIENVAVGGGQVWSGSHGTKKEGHAAMVDSGSSLVTAPPEIAQAILDGINVRQDCSNVKTLPNVSFVLSGGRALSLPPEDYVLQVAEKAGSNRSVCTPLVAPLDIPPPRGPIIILGTPLLRRYYTAFDEEHLRVGFALARHGFRPKPLVQAVHQNRPPLISGLRALLNRWNHTASFRQRLLRGMRSRRHHQRL